jgi:dUTP pyrophosphatase
MLQFKKLEENAVLPSRAFPTDAGLDLTATSVNKQDLFIEYGTGIAVAIPAGKVGLIFPRSSISNKNLMLANSVGVIDSQYRGEIKFRFRYGVDYTESEIYKVGDRIGQLVLVDVGLEGATFVEELTETDRGTGGFGSTNPESVL